MRLIFKSLWGGGKPPKTPLGGGGRADALGGGGRADVNKRIEDKGFNSSAKCIHQVHPPSASAKCISQVHPPYRLRQVNPPNASAPSRPPITSVGGVLGGFPPRSSTVENKTTHFAVGQALV